LWINHPERPVFWVGSDHGGALVKVEPLTKAFPDPVGPLFPRQLMGMAQSQTLTSGRQFIM